MPFMSYQVDEASVLRNAGLFLAEGGVHAVKLEGGVSMARTIARIVEAGIPVVGHVGLTPQSVHAMGGFKLQGKTEEDAERVLRDAKAVEEAGAFAAVLEGIPEALAARITSELDVPTIGIGAGVGCDGQVLVSYDLLGLTPDLKPKFVADILGQRPVRTRLTETPARSVGALVAMYDQAAAELAAAAVCGPLDQPLQHERMGTVHTYSRATIITHVTTHGMHHRAQMLNMLRHVGVNPLPPSSVAEWSRAGCPE